MIFEYTVIRTKRKSLSLQVDKNCKITVRAPLFISQKEIEEFVSDKKEWLEKAVITQRQKAKEQKNIHKKKLLYSEEKPKILYLSRLLIILR